LQPVAEVVSQRLGVNLIEAELFPDDKPCKITGLQRKHRKVVFLASETTAASSLATADVSIVTGFESNRMESAADALFLSNDLSDFAEIVRIARRANRIAAISFAIAVIVTSACLGLAIQGKISPQWAIAVRFALEVALMFSAAQLLTPLWKPRTLVVKS
jgi:cation transport ATPase